MSRWFSKLRSSNNPALRVFAYPYAGGNATTYFKLAKQLPESVELFAIQPPGRLQRFDEAPIGCANEMVNILRQEIAPYLDIPRVVLAYSNGCVPAFELERRLQIEGDWQLKHMILCAKRAPHLNRTQPAFGELTYDQKIDRLATFDRIPEDILRNPEEIAFLMPMFDADFALADDYQCSKDPKLHTNATLLAGDEDNYCSTDSVWAWRELIDGETECIRFNGGHFFKYQEEGKFNKEVTKVINRLYRMA